MTDTVRLVGQFLYQAEARPRNARNPRRVLFAAMTEYEIPCFRSDEVVEGALRFTPAGRKDVVSLTAHPATGTLWRGTDENGPVPLDEYRRRLGEWATTVPEPNQLFPGIERVPLRRDPIATVQGPDDDFAFPRFEGLDVHVEADFRGDIGRSNRAEAMARHLAAARHVAVIDGMVHYAAMPPGWLVVAEKNRPVGVQLIDRLPGFSRMSFHAVETGHWGRTRSVVRSSLDLFDATRHDEALAWATRRFPGRPAAVHGRIDHLDFAVPDPDPAALAVHGALPDLIGGIRHLKEHFGPETYALWGRLNDHARKATPYGMTDAPAPPLSIADMERLRTEFDGRMLPHAVESHAATLFEHVDHILDRLKFERALKPELSEEDDLALSRAHRP